MGLVSLPNRVTNQPCDKTKAYRPPVNVKKYRREERSGVTSHCHFKARFRGCRSPQELDSTCACMRASESHEFFGYLYPWLEHDNLARGTRGRNIVLWLSPPDRYLHGQKLTLPRTSGRSFWRLLEKERERFYEENHRESVSSAPVYVCTCIGVCTQACI